MLSGSTDAQPVTAILRDAAKGHPKGDREKLERLITEQTRTNDDGTMSASRWLLDYASEYFAQDSYLVYAAIERAVAAASRRTPKALAGIRAAKADSNLQQPETDAEWLARAKAEGVQSLEQLQSYLIVRRHPSIESVFQAGLGGHGMTDQIARNLAHRLWNGPLTVNTSIVEDTPQLNLFGSAPSPAMTATTVVEKPQLGRDYVTIQHAGKDVIAYAAGANPSRPMGERWDADRGAMPGEPIAFLDGDADTGSAAIVEELVRDAPDFSVFRAVTSEGEEIGLFSTPDEAARAAEAHVDTLAADQQAADEGAVRVKEKAVPPPRVTNTFQAPYQSASRVGTATAMIPINMAGATYGALSELESRHGAIDEYVADRLQYDVEELRQGKYFSPEQIDAIAMGIQAVESGRGMINADQTGLGKGRFVAAMLRYARLNERQPVFVTIKPELFTDIFRDIADIGSEHLFRQVFIFNDGVSVKRFGTEKDVLYPATRPADRAAALDTGTLPPGTDLVLATYSQFQREYEKNRKSRLLGEIATNNAMLLLDEAHVAAGASNVSFAVGLAVANSNSVVYASATPLKGVSNFAIYNKIFPSSVDMEALPETLSKGGEAMLEAISTNMSRDGVLIRREHDFSRLVFHTRSPAPDRTATNVAMANQLADILARMSVLSGDVSKIVSEINKDFREAFKDIPQEDRKGARMGATSMSFGSRLYSINRQFLLGIKIDEAVEASLDALKSGRKPVIAVENTGESLLRQVIARRAGVEALSAELELLEEQADTLDAADKARREELAAAIHSAMRDVTLNSPPQFRELLDIMLDRIGQIKVQGRYGEVSWREPESKEYGEAADTLREMIAEFPDLPLTPLDVVRKELAANGYRVAEVSGRTLSISPDPADPTKWKVAFHPKADAVANVAGFQSGKHDAIIITRSGSTGISLHATDRFANSDVRQRDFIVLQKAANIAEFLQWMGRVNRKDQVIEPIITSMESGLPAETRLTMMHNTKLRKLSANTTSNRDNANLEGDFDLLNEVGDKVALAWLQENPDVAEYLDIDLPDGDGVRDQENEAYYINKLLGRLMLVRVDKQEAILAALTEHFNDRLAELDAAGENPFKVDAHEWGATIVNETVLDSGVIDQTGSTFDEPVRLTTLNYDVPATPIRAERVRSWIDEAIAEHEGGTVTDSNGGLRTYRRRLQESRDRFVREQLPTKLQEMGDAPLGLLLEQSPAAKKAAEKADWLIGCVERYRPGTLVTVQDLLRGDRDGFIVRAEFPKTHGESFLLSKYRMSVLFPGEEKPQEVTLATVRSQGSTLGAVWASSDGQERTTWLMRRFDDEGLGNRTRTVHVLRGNLFRACEMASRERLGAPVLYTDEQGIRHRAVLLKDKVTPEMVKAIPIAFDARDLVAYVTEYLRPDHHDAAQRRHFGKLRIFNSSVKMMEPGEGIELTLLNKATGFRLSLPGTKAQAGLLMTDGAIFDLGERSEENGLRLALTGTRTVMRAEVEMERFAQLLTLLQSRRHISKFYIPDPDTEIIATLKARAAERGTSVAVGEPSPAW